MEGAKRFLRQLMEKLCVMITIILVYENALVFYQHLFPYWWTRQFYGKFFFHLIFGHWLLINTAMHYYIASSTSPGFVIDLQKDSNEKNPTTYDKCSKCDVMRPPRAHHCKICRKCVLRYDHHCPWLNNCVGYRNHIHFLLFCVYMTLIAAYATIVAQGQFQMVIFHDEKLFGLFDPILRPNDIAEAIVEHQTIGPITGVLTLFLFITNLVAMSLVFSLTVWQVSLISKGQTCVEEKINKSLMSNSNQKKDQPRPYDFGWKHNWTTFLEMNTASELLQRFLIPTKFQPKHDGTCWVTKVD